MKVLVIFSHPDPKSFNASLKDNFVKGLEDGKNEVKLIDLYKEKFNPSMRKEELHTKIVKDRTIRKYQKLILWADALVFIHPIWWYNTPAILKGFFDRTFTSGFAFKYEKGIPRGLLKHKKALLIATYDSPWILVHFYFGDLYYKCMTKPLLNFCGIKEVKEHCYTSVSTASGEKRKEWLRDVYGLGLNFRE